MHQEAHRRESRDAQDGEGITIEYLTKLYDGYEVLVSQFKDEGIQVIDVDWNEFRSTDELVGDVVKAWESIQNVHRIPAKKQ